MGLHGSRWGSVAWARGFGLQGGFLSRLVTVTTQFFFLDLPDLLD